MDWVPAIKLLYIIVHKSQTVRFTLEENLLVGGYSKVTGLKLQNNRLKVLLSVGGWNAGSLGFSDMVSTKIRRKTFIESAIKFLRKFNFDGTSLYLDHMNNTEDISRFI